MSGINYIKKKNWFKGCLPVTPKVMLFCVACVFNQQQLFGQVISNTAFVSVTSGTVVGVDTINNNISAGVSNDGTINFNTITNAGTIQGNGTYNVAKAFSNTGTFLPGTSTVNYYGSIDQTIAAMNYYNLTVSLNGTRNITLSNLGTIGIAGNFSPVTTSTTYITSGTTVNFNGSSSQTIPSFSYNNLSVDNISGATFLGTVNLPGVLKVTNGTLTTAGYLTLVSTATQTALIDGSGAGNVLGNVTMQRYLSSGFGYKYISSPFQAATVNELADDLNLGATFPSFYRYDENQLSSGWTTYTTTTGQLNPTQGYAGNFGDLAVAKTINITGVVNNNTLAAPTLYNHNRPFTKGFNLVGNPYPSPIDWNATSGWTKTNIDNAVYYFNASTTDQYTGTYSSYINGVSSDGIAGNIIPSMQGFFVHVTNGAFPVTGQLTFNNNVRTNDLSPVFHSFTGPEVRLSASYSDDVIAADPAVFYFDDQASKNFDTKRDALKLMNTNKAVPNLYAVTTDSAKLSIHAINYLRDSLTILPLGLTTEKDASVTFNARDIRGVSPNMNVYLYDSKAATYQDLRRNPDYRLYLTSGGYENRFFLVFSLAELGSVNTTPTLFDAYFSRGRLFVKTNIAYDENTQLVITNMLGQKIWSRHFDGNESYYIDNYLTSGIYIINLVTNKGVNHKKIFIGN